MTEFKILGHVDPETAEVLRATMLRAYNTFDGYSSAFRSAGISARDIAEDDPVVTLQRLPLLDGQAFLDLTGESFVKAGEIVDMETSSGTHGRAKRRAITRAGDDLDTMLHVDLFRSCGINSSDSVACVDIELGLMVWLTNVFDKLGVVESYAYSVGPDYRNSLVGLVRLDPTVILILPSLIEQCLPALSELYREQGHRKLKKIVYFGEPMAARTRSRLQSEFSVEVFSYYAASETTALGIECQDHDGIHLFTDRKVIEVMYGESQMDTGELVVTTLGDSGLPLLRYSLKDVVRVKKPACRCGLPYPRVDLLRRAQDMFTVLGSKFSYDSFLSAAYEEADVPGQMQLRLSRTSRDRVTVLLPEAMRQREDRIRQLLLQREPDLTHLLDGGYLELEISFVPGAHFAETRKRKKILDERSDAIG